MTEKTPSESNRRVLISWALYDFANSSFSAIVQTFVFASYFTKEVAASETIGAAEWGMVNAASALIVALLSPFFGAISDRGKSKKRWIATFAYLSILSAFLLWFVKPEPAYTTFALWIVGAGIVGSEIAFVFYNATLTEISSKKSLGKWSGIGWSMGYFGGICCLTAALFISISDPFLLGIQKNSSEQVRIIFPLTGLWYAFFSLPFFLFVPEKKGKGAPFIQAIKEGAFELKKTLTHLLLFKNMMKFLIARIFYIDALTTLFAFGGVYAATLFHMEEKEILLFGIAMNVSAGIGAVFMGPLDDLLGSKKIIVFSLICLLLATGSLLFVSNKSLFWALGMFLGLFVGPLQASSRSYMARAAPSELRSEMFGFFALSGKATAFAGPFLVGMITYLAGSQRAGMSIILLFFLIGLFCMGFVSENPEKPKKKQSL